jgi:hypothetical protein
MFVSLQFHHELNRLIEAGHDEFPRQVITCEVAYELLTTELLTDADFARTLVAMWTDGERLVVPIGPVEEHHLAIVDATLPTPHVRQHRIAEHDWPDAAVLVDIEPRRADAPGCGDNDPLIEQVGASGTLVARAYFRAGRVAGERVLEMAPRRGVQTIGERPQVD